MLRAGRSHCCTLHQTTSSLRKGEGARARDNGALSRPARSFPASSSSARVLPLPCRFEAVLVCWRFPRCDHFRWGQQRRIWQSCRRFVQDGKDGRRSKCQQQQWQQQQWQQQQWQQQQQQQWPQQQWQQWPQQQYQQEHVEKRGKLLSPLSQRIRGLVPPHATTAGDCCRRDRGTWVGCGRGDHGQNLPSFCFGFGPRVK